MLKHLGIQNLAIIESLEVDFETGMTIFTGETGAGKSILIGALNLILGERADPQYIRPQCKQAEVVASFDVAGLSPEVADWLKTQDLAADEDCVIRRILGADGRSRAYINGQLVALSELKSLTEKLVHLHGQHQNQALLKTEHQRQLLDAFAGKPALAEAVLSAYNRVQHLKKEQQRLLMNQGKSDKLMLLQYQQQELENLKLTPTTLQSLDTEHQKLCHADRWLNALTLAAEHLYSGEDNNVVKGLHIAITQVSTLIHQGAPLKNLESLLQNAVIQVEEAKTELETFQNTVNVDPEQLRMVDERLGQIHALARKHKVQPEHLFEHAEKLIQEIAELKNLASALTEVETSLEKALGEYQNAAQQLSEHRKKAALQLDKLITERCHQLDMQKGQFKIQIETDPRVVSPQGIDKIEFLVTLNPGQPLKPLAKIASGGEISRISLAIQVVTAQKTTTPTLIFDEVDVGISGKTAETVGKLLRTLGQSAQVLCVTHLPQVAACGHHHYRVEKHFSVEGSREETRTQVSPLSDAEKVEELARMLGGEKPSTHALQHAKALLEDHIA